MTFNLSFLGILAQKTMFLMNINMKFSRLKRRHAHLLTDKKKWKVWMRTIKFRKRMAGQSGDRNTKGSPADIRTGLFRIRNQSCGFRYKLKKIYWPLPPTWIGCRIPAGPNSRKNRHSSCTNTHRHCKNTNSLPYYGFLAFSFRSNKQLSAPALKLFCLS